MPSTIKVAGVEGVYLPVQVAVELKSAQGKTIVSTQRLAMSTIGPINLEIYGRVCPESARGVSSQELRCYAGSRICARAEKETLRRSEVVKLLSLALDTLLVPENRKRLRERLGKSEQCTIEVLPQLPQAAQIVSSPGIPRPSSQVPEEIFLLSSQFDEQVYSVPGVEVSVEVLPPQLQESITIAKVDDRVSDDNHKLSSTEELEISDGDSSLSTMRRLKTLNVHTYVHNALRVSHLRSYMKSRTIEE